MSKLVKELTPDGSCGNPICAARTRMRTWPFFGGWQYPYGHPYLFLSGLSVSGVTSGQRGTIGMVSNTFHGG